MNGGDKVTFYWFCLDLSMPRIELAIYTFLLTLTLCDKQKVSSWIWIFIKLNWSQQSLWRMSNRLTINQFRESINNITLIAHYTSFPLIPSILATPAIKHSSAVATWISTGWVILDSVRSRVHSAIRCLNAHVDSRRITGHSTWSCARFSVTCV